VVCEPLPVSADNDGGTWASLEAGADPEQWLPLRVSCFIVEPAKRQTWRRNSAFIYAAAFSCSDGSSVAAVAYSHSRFQNSQWTETHPDHREMQACEWRSERVTCMMVD
jgi:hypothetical protein